MSCRQTLATIHPKLLQTNQRTWRLQSAELKPCPWCRFPSETYTLEGLWQAVVNGLWVTWWISDDGIGDSIEGLVAEVRDLTERRQVRSWTDNHAWPDRQQCAAPHTCPRLMDLIIRLLSESENSVLIQDSLTDLIVVCSTLLICIGLNCDCICLSPSYLTLGLSSFIGPWIAIQRPDLTLVSFLDSKFQGNTRHYNPELN